MTNFLQRIAGTVVQAPGASTARLRPMRGSIFESAASSMPIGRPFEPRASLANGGLEGDAFASASGSDALVSSQAYLLMPAVAGARQAGLAGTRGAGHDASFESGDASTRHLADASNARPAHSRIEPRDSEGGELANARPAPSRIGPRDGEGGEFTEGGASALSPAAAPTKPKADRPPSPPTTGMARPTSREPPASADPSQARAQALSRRAAAAREPDEIHIHIGRIEVAAIASPPSSLPPAPRKSLGLDEYLRRSDGKRR